MKPDKKEILITGECILKDIQNTFSAFYPFLKIEFLESNARSKSQRRITVHSHTSLNKLKNIHEPQKISVENNRTVAEVSKDLENSLGLVVEMSRKSGNVWNVISVTDGWTLENQNASGQFISSVMTVPFRGDQ